jgi:hypothetical protein
LYFYEIRSSVRPHYDKPLNLKLQWILKEMTQLSGKMRRTTSVLNIYSTIPSSSIKLITQNLTDTLKSHDLDDYPNDGESDYSDYAYEDSTDEMTTTTTTTTTTTITTTRRSTTTTTPIDDEISIDDTNTAYYDYADHDLYSDDELEETATAEEPVIITTTKQTTTTLNWKDRIPFYHRRPPIIWNVDRDDNDDDNDQKSAKQEQRRNSGSSLHYSLLLLLTMYISRV